jgi:uncharacterized Zn-finger protein
VNSDFRVIILLLLLSSNRIRVQIMNTKSLTDNVSLMRIAIFFGIFSSAFGVFLMYRLDYMIHGDLYNYNLQSSPDWLFPMWTLERLIGVCLILPMALGSAVLVWDFRSCRKKTTIVKRVEPAKPLQSNNLVKAQALRENSMVISCPNCKKVFGKPLVMLDFSGKETKLVNVCPYCNEILGRACGEVEKDNVNIGILDQDEKVEKRR